MSGFSLNYLTALDCPYLNFKIIIVIVKMIHNIPNRVVRFRGKKKKTEYPVKFEFQVKR